MSNQSEHKAIVTWMESLGFKVRHGDMYGHGDLSRLFNEEEAAIFYNAHLDAVAEARDEALTNATQHLYSSSQIRQALHQALRSKTKNEMVNEIIEDVADELAKFTSPNHKGAPHE